MALESVPKKAGSLLIESTSSMRGWRSEAERAGKTVGLVPTMGALHEGHLSLIRAARSQCDQLAVSIFVNPLQFGPHEDFDKYPRTLEQDLQLCEAAGVDAIFHPPVADVYSNPKQELTTTVVPPPTLANCLEGAFRPGFFTGVATVVIKLFNIVRPHKALFGEKDYQQWQVIRRMVEDLSLPIEIIGMPTVRESDGLALSSRNVYLSPQERQIAPVLHQALTLLVRSVNSGATVEAALGQARHKVQEAGAFELQYLELCDANSLEPLKTSRKPMVALIAAKIGSVRLIDNIVER